jgi:hypothetical protein
LLLYVIAYLGGVLTVLSHGVDTDAAGNGVVDAERLYQLVRQKGAVRDRLFKIEFPDPGVQAFRLAFG